MYNGILGYIMMMSNMGVIGGTNSQLKDFSIKVESVSLLKNTLIKYPICPIESFRNNNYCRKGDTGMFLSENVRDYIFKKNVKPSEQGLIMKLYFERRKGAKPTQPENLNILWRSDKLDEMAAQAVLEYVEEINTGQNLKPGFYLHKID